MSQSMERLPTGADGAPPRNFRQTLLAMLGLCFVLVMVALDQTVIGTALPTVVAELNGFDLYAWVGTSYLLTSVIAVPIFGKLGDDHGRKPFVMAAIVLFTLASMLCGLAHSMLQLVLARALQGIGGGMLVATSFASVPDLFPEARERLRWQILFSSSFGLANAVGPSLGGYLAEYWGWRWVFFVNLPVGIASLGFVWRYLPKIRHSEQPPSRMDWLGALLVALTLGSLQLLVEWLPQHKPPAEMIALGMVGAAACIALIWWERRCENPVLPLDMLTHRSLVPLFSLSLVMGFCMFAVMYYAPLLFQGGFGLSPNQAGLLVTPLAVCITVGSIVNGRIVTRLEQPNVMLYVGIGFFWVAALALTQTTAATPHMLIALAMMSGGLGLGLLLPNLTLLAQACAPRTQLGVATAMLQSMRMVGGMLGTALIGTFVAHRYASGIDDMLAAGRGGQWTVWLEDPQILVNHALAAKFAAAVSMSGQNAAMLMDGARASLVGAIHRSQWLVVAFMCVALFGASRVPPIKLHRRAGDPVNDNE
jgi:EmrB/QacA subfamily drug resistance transporter